LKQNLISFASALIYW